MKLIYCPKCHDLFSLVAGRVNKCGCGEYGGKYLNDHLTAVVVKDSILVGIDNNTFQNAYAHYEFCREHSEDYPTRLDFYIVGWIPTIPGEVLYVDTMKEVEEFDMDYDAGNEGSTRPVGDE